MATEILRCERSTFNDSETHWQHRRRRVANPEAGQIQLQIAIRIVDWIATRKMMPTAAEVMAEFDVCRATAYRWLNCFCDARGIYRERALGNNGKPDFFIPMQLPPAPKPRYEQWARAQA